MQKYLVLFLAICVSLLSWAAREPKPVEVDSMGRKIKTGWNFGVLPTAAYDPDYGFQGGALANIYYYGNGSQYPEYLHSLYVEADYSTKHHGVFRLNYDSKYLIPGHLLMIDATYLPDAMCDFYGYNGYQSLYRNTFASWNANPKKMDAPDDYRSRVFYKHKRDLIRFAADIQGNIIGDLHWNAGIGVLGYIISNCDIRMLNGKSEYDPSLPRYAQKALDPAMQGLYGKYVEWGIIGADEKNGGWHPYLRGGISYDTRDRRQGPTNGIYADLFFTYSAAFNAAYGQQATAGYNHLQLNFTFRHYVPVYQDRIVFAYRIGTQNVIAGRSPFYMNTYLNVQAIKRDLYEGLGGGNSLRGIMMNRVMADGFAFTNIEFRFRLVDFDLWKQHFFLAANPFFDMGIVTQPMRVNEDAVRTAVAASAEKVEDFFCFDKRELYYPHMSAGLGLKAGMNENFVLSLDWAIPVGDRYHRMQDNAGWANFYVKMGYLF